MREYRALQVACRVLSTAFVSICLVCCPSNAQAGETFPLDDPNTVMRTLLSALKTTEVPVKGRGTAVMKIENVDGDIEGKELNVDFVFKDQKSRMDVFESDGPGEGLRVYAAAKSDKNSILIGRYDVTIQQQELYGGDVGRDFHPDVFFKFLGEKSLVEWMEYELANTRSPMDRTIELDNNGILRLSIRAHVVIPRRPERDREEYDAEEGVWFDTRKGLKPVFCQRKFTYADGSCNAIQTKLQWAKFGSVWYVSAFEYNEPPSSHRHTVGTITSFSPDIEVSDREFTLDGMSVPVEMMVFDKIAGVSYRFKEPISLIDDMEKPLSEADFAQKIRNERPSVTGQTEVDDGDSVPTAIMGKTHPHSPWRDTVVIVCVAGLILGLTFLACRHAPTHAKR